MMEQAVRAAITAGVPVGTLVTWEAIPEGHPWPVVRLQEIIELADIAHDGDTGLHRHLVQVDCFAVTRKEAKTIHRQIQAAMLPPFAFFEKARDLDEPAENGLPALFRVCAEYTIFHSTE